MKTIICISFLVLLGIVVNAQAVSVDLQIKGAVLAAPAELRDGAMVYGFGQKGELIILRKGTNEMVCIADNPDQAGFSVSCYQKDLDPFMARGRELRTSGKSQKEIFDQRELDVKSGKLLMPKQPATLYVFSAPTERYNTTT